MKDQVGSAITLFLASRSVGAGACKFISFNVGINSRLVLLMILYTLFMGNVLPRVLDKEMRKWFVVTAACKRTILDFSYPVFNRYVPPIYIKVV